MAPRRPSRCPAPGALALPDTGRNESERVVQTLRGEVMDAKCWLGVMRPGQGKTHRACATLCLIGGIPPLFAVKTPGGYAAYVLTDRDGGPAGPRWSAWAGLPSEVQGFVERRDGLTWLRAEGGPRRLADADRAATAMRSWPATTTSAGMISTALLADRRAL